MEKISIKYKKKKSPLLSDKNKKSENNSIVKVRNESKKDLSNEILKDREKNLSEIDLSKNRNLAQNILDNILIAIDVNFTDKNIAKFSFIDELWSKNWGR